MVTLEQLLDKIATSLIENINKYAPEGEEKETLLANQHTIKNGIMQSTRAYDEKLKQMNKWQSIGSDRLGSV